VTVAHAVHSASVLGAVRISFVHGLDVMLWVCAGIALASAILAVIVLPRRTRRDAATTTSGPAADETAVQRAELGL
jgi:DHA2 family multidrug resistance protein-like MFS transporter